MSTRFYEALEHQMATLRYVESGGANQLIENTIQMNIQDRLGKESSGQIKQIGTHVAVLTSRIIKTPLIIGSPYWWDGSLCSALEVLAAEVPLNWVLRQDQFPTPHGYIRFARPLALPLYEGNTREDLVAISWTSIQWGGEKQDQEFNTVAIVFHTSDKIRPLGNPATICPWPFGRPIDDSLEAAALSPGLSRDKEVTMKRWGRKVQYFAAALDFMNSKLVAQTEETVPREVRKRAQRAGYESTSVQVVRLRRHAANPNGPTEFREVDWQWQWVVRPHYRQQFYPSEGVRRPIFIQSYVKGPEDKPLKPASGTLFAVVQ